MTRMLKQLRDSRLLLRLKMLSILLCFCIGIDVAVHAQQIINPGGSTTVTWPVTTTFYADANRTDSYTANGTALYPYKNLDTLYTAIAAYQTAGGTGPIAVNLAPASSYATAGAISTTTLPTILYCNGSTLTFSGNMTANGPAVLYDCNTAIAPYTFAWAYTGSTRSEVRGGSFLGNWTVAYGNYVHAYDTNLSGNSYSGTISGSFYGEAMTGSQSIVSGGTGAVLLLNNNNMTKSSGVNIDMTAGGVLMATGGLYGTASGTANINMPTANTTAAPNVLSNILFTAGTGVTCASGTTTYLIYDRLSIPPTNCTMLPMNYGAEILTANGLPGVPSITVSGTPYSGGTGTTTYPLVSIWPSGATAPTTWSTGGTMFGINASSGFTGDLISTRVNGATSGMEVTYQGKLIMSSTITANSGASQTIMAPTGGVTGLALGGSGAATLAAGAAAGTSPTIACTTSHVCSYPNGTITLTTGTSPTTGALATVTTSLTHTNYSDCRASYVPTATATTATPVNLPCSASTTVLTIYTGTALTAGTSYQITYHNLGY